MSQDGSTSQSDSSNSSSSQLSFFQDNFNDLTLYGSTASFFVRTGTVVRRANSVPFRKDRLESPSSTEDDDGTPVQKYRKDSHYRHSLAAISERRSARNSLTSESGKMTHRHHSSMETSSDNTDDPPRSSLTEHSGDKTKLSPSSSSYLSWIETVDVGNTHSNISDIDTKVGEWNNFWLNYSNARLRHLSTEPACSSDGERTADETSDERKSPESPQKDITGKNSMECIMLTMEEINETMWCSQRINAIMQNAIRRSEIDGGSNESYYSQPLSCKASIKEDGVVNVKNRERSVSCVTNPPSLQRQNQLLTSTKQSSSTSCINTILSTGVADILRKVISKRREVIASDSDAKSTMKSSFSEWSEK